MQAVRLLTISGVLAIAVGYTGCTTRGVATSVAPRIFREVHALRARSYTIIAVTSDLRSYKAVEIRSLDNMMLDQIPERSVQRLNSGIAERIRSLNHFEQVRVAQAQTGNGDPAGADAGRSSESDATIVIEGYIDDYTPGIPKLRLIEKGDNHAVLTVRILLRDKSTSAILGESNITAENARVTSNIDRMVDKAASEIAKYVRRSTTRTVESKEELANAYQ